MLSDTIAEPNEQAPRGSCIRVLIVDDHAVVRRGLATCLAVFDDVQLVGEAGEGKEALALCERLQGEGCQPDVVLMDLVMPGMNGIDATRLIGRRWPWIRVIALTSFEDEALWADARHAGFSTYLLKNISSSELVEAIHSVHATRPAA